MARNRIRYTIVRRDTCERQRDDDLITHDNTQYVYGRTLTTRRVLTVETHGEGEERVAARIGICRPSVNGRGRKSRGEVPRWPKRV